MSKRTIVQCLHSLTVYAVVAAAGFAFAAGAQTPAGDADRGSDQFEATCSECHGPAATAPTLRGIINREIASDANFTGYSDAMKAKKPMKWTKANLNDYLIAPKKYIPGSFMNREYPDAQMRADVIAFLETLPPPKE